MSTSAYTLTHPSTKPPVSVTPHKIVIAVLCMGVIWLSTIIMSANLVYAQETDQKSDNIFEGSGFPPFPSTIEQRAWHPVLNSLYVRGSLAVAGGVSLPVVEVSYENINDPLDYPIKEGGYPELKSYSTNPASMYRIAGVAEILYRHSHLFAPYFAFGFVWEQHFLAAETTYDFVYFPKDSENNYSEHHRLDLNFMRAAALVGIGFDVEPVSLYPLTGVTVAFDYELGWCGLSQSLTTTWLPAHKQFTKTVKQHPSDMDQTLCNSFILGVKTELFGHTQIGIGYGYYLGNVFTNRSGFVNLSGDQWFGTLAVSF